MVRVPHLELVVQVVVVLAILRLVVLHVVRLFQLRLEYVGCRGWLRFGVLHRADLLPRAVCGWGARWPRGPDGGFQGCPDPPIRPLRPCWSNWCLIMIFCQQRQQGPAACLQVHLEGLPLARRQPRVPFHARCRRQGPVHAG